jgi:hypothetical protein
MQSTGMLGCKQEAPAQWETLEVLIMIGQMFVGVGSLEHCITSGSIFDPFAAAGGHSPNPANKESHF